MCCCSANNVICCTPVIRGSNVSLMCDAEKSTEKEQWSFNNSFQPSQIPTENQKVYELFMTNAAHFLQVRPKVAIIHLDLASRFLSCCTLGPEREVELYVNYATAYEQLEDWTKAAKFLDEAISILHMAGSSITKEQLELLAFLYIRLALLHERRAKDYMQIFNSWFHGALLCARVNRTAQAEYCAWRATQWIIKASLQKTGEDRISDIICSIKLLSWTKLKGKELCYNLLHIESAQLLANEYTSVTFEL